MTTRADYEKRLREHLKETKSHATKVAQADQATRRDRRNHIDSGPEGATKAAQNIKGVVGKAKAAAQGPLHLARGSGEQAKMLHNARAEYREEARRSPRTR